MGASSPFDMNPPKSIKTIVRGCVMTINIKHFSGRSKKVRVSISSDSQWRTIRWDGGTNLKNVNTFKKLFLEEVNTDKEAPKAVESDKGVNPMTFLFKNTTFKHSVLGNVELKYISHGDVKDFIQYLNETDSRYFAALIIYHQLINPKIKIENIEAWTDKDLENACSNLLDNEPTIARYFQRNPSHSFYEDFQKAFVENRKEQGRIDINFSSSILTQMQSQYGDALKTLVPVINSDQAKSVLQMLNSYNFRNIADTMRTYQSALRFMPPIMPFPTVPSVRQILSDVPLTESSELQLSPNLSEVNRLMIEPLLNAIDPNLEKKRKGAWQTYQSNSDDCLSQAMHSMREVLRQLLDKLAPEDQIPNA
jgi:hypothetical protein